MHSTMEPVGDDEVARVRRRLHRVGTVLRNDGFDGWLRSADPLTFSVGDELHINQSPYRAVYSYLNVDDGGSFRAVVYVDGVNMYRLQEASDE